MEVRSAVRFRFIVEKLDLYDGMCLTSVAEPGFPPRVVKFSQRQPTGKLRVVKREGLPNPDTKTAAASLLQYRDVEFTKNNIRDAEESPAGLNIVQSKIRRLLSAPITQIDLTDPQSNGNHTQKFIVEAVNAEKQLWKLIHLKGLLHIDVQELYRKACSSYKKIILIDHELAELQDIEYSLWKLHYKHIDEYRNRIRQNSATKERRNLATAQDVATMQHRSDDYLEGFKSFLSEATEFYHHLIKNIRRSYGLSEELFVFNEGGFSSSIDSTTTDRCRFSCHRFLVCLGDLARYRELYGTPDGETRNWSVAATHYLNASMIWPDSGNPHNQLAVLAIYVGDELLALYHCIRSLAVEEPFPDAWDNLILLFEKNKSSQLHSLSNKDAFNFVKPSERSVQINAQSSDSFPISQSKVATGDVLTERTELWTLIVRMISCFYVKPSLEDFPCVFGSTIRELEALLSLDDGRLKLALESYQCMEVARTGPFRLLQLVSVLIFTIYTLSDSSKLQKAKHIEYAQQPFLVQQAFTITFIFMGRLVNRCMMADPVDSSPLLPAILVFVEWLVEGLDRAEECMTDDKCASGTEYFFNAFVDLLNQFDDERSEIDSPDFCNLWEDNELRGFSPISQFHVPLRLDTPQKGRYISKDTNEYLVRVRRIFIAAKKIANKSTGPQIFVIYDETRRKFYTRKSRELPGRSDSIAGDGGLDLEVRGLQQKKSMPKDVPLLHEDTEGCEVTPSEDDEKGLDVCGSIPVEEEEVILFKPITRYNSAPLYLPQATSCQVPDGGLNLEALSGAGPLRGLSLHLPKEELCVDPINRSSNVRGPSNKTFWQEPIPEDSVMDSFTEFTDSPRFKALSAESEELPFLAGPPSLNAWVVNQDNLRIEGRTGLKEASEQGPKHAENIASTYLTGLSIGGPEVIQQDVEKASYAPSSHFMLGSVYNGDFLTGCPTSYATSHHMEPPYMPPVPSAPLLPDDATWFNGNSSNYADHKNFLSAEHVNGYPTGIQGYPTGIQGLCNFGPNIPRLSDVYTPYSGQTNSAQWLQQYQVNLDQARDNFPPLQSYTPTTFGRYLNHDVSTVDPCDQRTNPLALHPMKRMEDLPYYPGFISVPAPSPYAYGAVRDLRSEQQLLLKYLKEKEWHLQQEAQLRGSA